MQTDWLPQGGTLMKRTIVANAVALSLAAGAYAQSTSQPQAKAETGSSSSAAASQSSNAKKGETDTVMITATKRLGGIQDVAVPVSAISGAALTELGIANSQELLSRIPSTDLTLNNGSTNANICLYSCLSCSLLGLILGCSAVMFILLTLLITDLYSFFLPPYKRHVVWPLSYREIIAHQSIHEILVSIPFL